MYYSAYKRNRVTILPVQTSLKCRQICAIIPLYHFKGKLYTPFIFKGPEDVKKRHVYFCSVYGNIEEKIKESIPVGGLLTLFLC